jgi:hypothetical protein
MSAIEERLARDIAAVTGGVVVTESDLQEAREVLEGRIDRGRRERRRILAVAATAAIVIPVVGFVAFRVWDADDRSAPPVGPAPTTPADTYAGFLTGRAPTPALLEGVWRVDNGTTVLRFSSPDVVSFDNKGELLDDPSIQGTYAIAGDLITVNVDAGSAECAGQTFAMRASLPERGAMRFVHTEPGTGDCTPEFVQVDDPPGSYDDVSWALEQLLPTGDLADFEPSRAPGKWKPMADPNGVDGDWLAEGGGYLLELARDGSYYIADDGRSDVLAGKSTAVIDQGQWSLRGTQLTLISSAATLECDQGDHLILSELEHLNTDTTVVRGTVAQNGCGGDWGLKTWFLIPNQHTAQN